MQAHPQKESHSSSCAVDQQPLGALPPTSYEQFGKWVSRCKQFLKISSRVPCNFWLVFLLNMHLWLLSEAVEEIGVRGGGYSSTAGLVEYLVLGAGARGTYMMPLAVSGNQTGFIYVTAAPSDWSIHITTALWLDGRHWPCMRSYYLPRVTDCLPLG